MKEKTLAFVKRNPLQVFLSMALLLIALWLSVKGICHCPFNTWLHLPCPNCGMYRCVSSLLHGDIRMAWNYNISPFVGAGAIAFLKFFKGFAEKHYMIIMFLFYMSFWMCMVNNLANPYVYLP